MLAEANHSISIGRLTLQAEPQRHVPARRLTDCTITAAPKHNVECVGCKRIWEVIGPKPLEYLCYECEFEPHYELPEEGNYYLTDKHVFDEE